MTVVIENEAIAIQLLHDRDFLLVGGRIECPAGERVVIPPIATGGVRGGASVDADGPFSAAIRGLVAGDDHPRVAEEAAGPDVSVLLHESGTRATVRRPRPTDHTRGWWWGRG